jgi:lipopolysaccharide export system protein LptC
LAAAYPADAVRGAAFSRRSNTHLDRTYRAALRHSRYVRLFRLGLPFGIAGALFAVVMANYFPAFGEFRLPDELGKVVIRGNKLTMQQPKISGYTSDSRSYKFKADTASQDLTKPDIVELHQIQANMEMEDKSSVELTAPSGTYDLKAETLVLNEDISLVSTTGYSARLTEAKLDMRSGNVVSDKPVRVNLLTGVLNAKRLEVLENGGVIRFMGGVHMLMHPDETKEGAQQ